MPHLVVDCSASVLLMAEPEELMRTVYDAAASSGLFATRGVGGIKVRLRSFDHHLNVDDHEHFVHLFAHIMGGRSEKQRYDLARRLTVALSTLLPEVEIISVNVSEFERSTYCNRAKLRSELGPSPKPG